MGCNALKSICFVDLNMCEVFVCMVYVYKWKKRRNPMFQNTSNARCQRMLNKQQCGLTKNKTVNLLPISVRTKH